MDTNSYVVEQMIRDRLVEARAAARCAALLRQSNGRSGRTNRVGRRVIELGRSLAKEVREGAFMLARALTSRKPVTKRS